MKKSLLVTLALSLVLVAAGCSKTTENTTEEVATEVEDATEAVEEDATEAEDTAEADTAEAEAEADTENAATAEGVMSYADYVAAAVDTEVCVETYVQAKQAWWEDNGVGQATFYTQNQDGAFFVYNLPCSQEDYDKLVPGTKIKVTGFKSEWSGEVEITDATYEIEDTDTFVADAKDVTDLLGKDELIDYQNQFVSFKGMTVESANDAGDAFFTSGMVPVQKATTYTSMYPLTEIPTPSLLNLICAIRTAMFTRQYRTSRLAMLLTWKASYTGMKVLTLTSLL